MDLPTAWKYRDTIKSIDFVLLPFQLPRERISTKGSFESSDQAKITFRFAAESVVCILFGWEPGKQFA